MLADLRDLAAEHGECPTTTAVRGLLDMAFRIDSTDVRAMPSDPDASKCYDSTAEENYYGYGCTIVSTGSKIPIAAEFTESKQASEETAMRVTVERETIDLDTLEPTTIHEEQTQGTVLACALHIPRAKEQWRHRERVDATDHPPVERL